MRGEDDEEIAPPLAQTYQYDQLNRLAYAHTHDMTTTVSNSNLWNSVNPVNNYKTNYTYDANGNIITMNRYNNNADQIDNFTYNYPTNRNRLRHVNDAVASGVSPDDIDDQEDDNYAYDKIGNLIKDEQEEIANIEWNVAGKIKKITRAESSTKDDMEFRYDAMGHRVVKIAKPRPGGNPSNDNKWEYTYYIRDANGNIMATYTRHTIEADDTYTVKFDLKEHTIYGSSRLGISRKPATEAPHALLAFADDVTFNTDGSYNLSSVIPTLTSNTENAYLKLHYLGLKEYELSNHLGNVLATVSDIKTPIEDNGDIVGYEADVKSANIYDPFGMIQRKLPSSNYYAYGFGGHENMNEVSGSGNTVDMGDRWLDTRLARTPKPDKLVNKFPSESPYSYAGNDPINLIDVNGEFKFSAQTLDKLKKYPIAYNYLTKTDIYKKGNIMELVADNRVVSILIKNTMYHNLRHVPLEERPTFDNLDKFKLDSKKIEFAFMFNNGPEIVLREDPGGTSMANGYNFRDDGTDYTTPIELNEKMFETLNNAKSAKAKRAALTNIISVLINEYMEDFGKDITPKFDSNGNKIGEFGGQPAQKEIFGGTIPSPQTPDAYYNILKEENNTLTQPTFIPNLPNDN